MLPGFSGNIGRSIKVPFRTGRWTEQQRTIQTAKWILVIRKFVSTKYINPETVVKLVSSEGWGSWVQIGSPKSPRSPESLIVMFRGADGCIEGGIMCIIDL